ncbi:PspC domain-containing protein [Iocasia frigidifontis]|uniref:PspC domain-containing protein n=1 Tax=Iocasia fonsfrigidae TaxID=2682810 RepID=A0A8A7KIQ4_9FIRM|nr:MULTISPECIES: PspC domain-containing protein [Halanaerobiaceae]AZO93213.1 PspC domain-containing protein [Halocella sp. SP3-1]QTL99469.1 PspC domain-containing protein [Iocasia fonsfrigidae]
MAKKIYRSREDRIIGGVCGGIADYLALDPTWVRLALLVLFFTRGVGVMIYLLAWIIIPEKPEFNSQNEENFAEGDNHDDYVNVSTDGIQHKENNKRLLGILLMLIGLFFLLDNWLPYINWERFWPVIIIAAGIVLLIKGVREK